jgi:hypothetical protein
MAYPLLFFVAQGVRGGGLDWLKEGWNLTALSGLAALYLLAWQLHRQQRLRRRVLPLLLEHPIFRATAGSAVLAAVYLLHRPATGYRNVLPLAGAALLLLSVPIYARRPLRAMLAELAALLAAIAAGELAWLAPLLAAVYEAWLVDWQLSPVSLRKRAVEAMVNLAETPSPPAPLPEGEGSLLSSPPASLAEGERSLLPTPPAPVPEDDGKLSGPYWPYLYPLLAAACAAVIGVKLVGRVLPYHFGF